jgi:hypothetical protein
MKLPLMFVVVALLIGAIVYSCSRPTVYDWTLKSMDGVSSLPLCGHTEPRDVWCRTP